MKPSFEARLEAYRSIVGRVLNFFLEPDIIPLSEIKKHATISQLLSESILLGSEDLGDLLSAFKLKVIDFHKVLNIDEDLSMKLHKELGQLASKIFYQMRLDIGIDDDDFAFTKPTQGQNSQYFGSKMLIWYFRDYFLSQASILVDIGRNAKLHGRAKEILSAIMSTTNTAYSIADLIKNEMFFNECVMLSRGFFERIVNICFLLTCDEDSFNEYRLHSKQKTYRKLEERFKAGDAEIYLKYSGKKSLEENIEMQEAIKAFSTKEGKEIKQWPKLKIPERIQLIQERAKIKPGMFLLYQLMFYTDASEALHGSFYGTTFHLGWHIPSINTLDEAIVEFRKKIPLFLQICAELIHVLIIVLSQSNDVDSYLKKSELNSKKAITELKKALKKH